MFAPGIGAFKQWMHERSTDSPILDNNSGNYSSDIHNVLAHDALLHSRLQNWSSAFEDARQSVDNRPSAMGYIIMAFAQIGMGEPEKAMQVFDPVFKICNPNEKNVLLLIKAIFFFMAEKYDKAISRVNYLIVIAKDDEIIYSCIQVLAKMYLMRGDYECALQSLERGRGLASSCTGCHLETISIIFGWSFDGLEMTARRYRCEALLTGDRVEKAAEVLLEIMESFSEIHTNEATAEWVTDLKTKCVHMLEELGDAALTSGQHDEAIAWYSSALSLKPSNPIDILVKRSKVRTLKRLWAGALTDANEVIALDPSSPRGFEVKYAALRGAEDFVEASDN